MHSQHFPLLPGRNKSKVDLKPLWDVPENPQSEQWNITQEKSCVWHSSLLEWTYCWPQTSSPRFTCTNVPALAPCPFPGDLTSYPSLPTPRIHPSTEMSHPAPCPGQYLDHPLAWPPKLKISVSHTSKELWKANPNWAPQWAPWEKSYCCTPPFQGAPWKSKLGLGWCWVVWISSYSALVLE